MLQGASNSMYGVVKNQVYYPGSSAPMHMGVTLNGVDLSERSEQQQQCRFFMNTGTCKYGDHCKYTHVSVRVSPPPPPPNFMNPFVLPARPVSPFALSSGFDLNHVLSQHCSVFFCLAVPGTTTLW